MLENTIRFYTIVVKEKKEQLKALSLQIKSVEEQLELFKKIDEIIKDKEAKDV